jgi:peroxiredoxin
MKKIALIFLLCSIACATAMAQAAPGGLKVNDKAPDFSAKNQNGKPVVLKDQLAKGMVVLVFYRGEWCPYCNRQLKALEDSMSLITKKGAAIIAVSPESQENVSKTVAKTKASYSIVSDNNLKIMNAYKVAYTVDKEMAQKLKGYGIDLAEKNGTNGSSLPVPAVYVINKSGTIVYSYYDENYKNRVSVREILTHL